MQRANPRPERRVLDKARRAVIRHYDGGYRVEVGDGHIWHKDYNDAFVTAYMHDSMAGFDVSEQDRRAS